MEREVYKKMYDHEDDFWWHKGMRSITDSMLSKYLPNKKENIILDAGCGTGSMFAVLSKYGMIWGVDKSKDALLYAAKRGMAKELRQNSVEKLSFADNTFDLVVCSDVLYHQWVEDENAAIKELYRVLKPGGTFFIREAAYNWLRSQHDSLVWTRHRFNRKELVSKLEEANFKVKKSSYVNFFLFPLALLKRLSEKIIPEKDPLQHTFFANKLTNYIFKLFLYCEAWLIKYIRSPFGLSIICVAKK
jgi:ubiquinone/menaquinone biosynthesis C-methylase UbiE